MLITDHLLLNYKRCNRRTFLEIYGDVQQRNTEKDFIIKLKRENQTHITNTIRNRWIDTQDGDIFNFQQPQASRRDWQLNAAQTIELMADGAEYIIRGTLSVTLPQWQTLFDNNFVESNLAFQQQEFFQKVTFTAAPTLLIKQPGSSRFGDWEYIPVNIKLGRRSKPEYKLVSAFHSQLLGIIQERIPERSQLILKDENDYFINLDIWLIKMQEVIVECLAMLAQKNEPEVFISRQRCSLCSWYNYCYQIAKSANHLSLVPGVTPKRYEYMQNIGVDNFESLVNVSETKLAQMFDDNIARQLKQQTMAIKSDRPLVRSDFDLINTQPIPTGVFEIYFDIEAEPERKIDYLLGVLLIDRSNNTEKFYAFVAEKPEDEGEMWQDFLDFMALYPDAPIFHYSEYEIDTIKRLSSLYHTPQAITKELISRLVDLHLWVIESTIFPVESYSLKALANWIGFYWRETTGSGDQSVCWYDRWLATGDRALLELILSYNEDDCRATRHLKDWLLDFLEYQRTQLIVNRIF
ncbi:TM0106 family RecB-like putative nuclease [Waterburya agarophytonicola K14]|uniref:TM0106 family RecB-like putative nuclease n=1 Tax=Waterburya agarophytonicola KI4 TaxID=2874699 RepID=A0A964BSW0_9CYAN|nr:TM0106 family RecB-like putative nuclease [Waterburya agarophytonicola]MCC0178206.1 TM0106 family RecB-like putative nuclease [Waterburya agarophytonicola KI4]